MQVKSSQASDMLAMYIKANIVPLLKGSPGCGKSQIVHQVAKEYGLKVIDLRLAQCDPTDLGGFPTIIDGRADYVPMKHFPIEGDAIPKGYNGWLLFLDELTSAPAAVQAAGYKLILDRQVGIHNLHKNVAIVGAGNLETDNAIVETMSTALQSRMAHMELVLDTDEWLDWAMKASIDSRITSFIRYMPQKLYTFKPDHSDQTYACPRTWEMSDRILKVVPEDYANTRAMLAGTLSEGVAAEFTIFMKIYQDLPPMKSILTAPETTKVPEEPSILYALTGALAEHMTLDNFEDMLKYILRMPAEFQVVCLKEGRARNPQIIQTKGLQQWSLKMAEYF